MKRGAPGHLTFPLYFLFLLCGIDDSRALFLLAQFIFAATMTGVCYDSSSQIAHHGPTCRHSNTTIYSRTCTLTCEHTHILTHQHTNTPIYLHQHFNVGEEGGDGTLIDCSPSGEEMVNKVTKLKWHKHVFSVRSMVYELCSRAMGVSLLSLMLEEEEQAWAASSISISDKVVERILDRMVIKVRSNESISSQAALQDKWGVIRSESGIRKWVSRQEESPGSRRGGAAVSEATVQSVGSIVESESGKRKWTSGKGSSCVGGSESQDGRNSGERVLGQQESPGSRRGGVAASEATIHDVGSIVESESGKRKWISAKGSGCVGGPGSQDGRNSGERALGHE